MEILVGALAGLLVAVALCAIFGYKYLHARTTVLEQAVSSPIQACSKCGRFVARHFGSPPVCANCDPKGFNDSFKNKKK